MEALHEHAWAFTFAAGAWSASCRCGLAVAVEDRGRRQVWEWTLAGPDEVPADLMLAGVQSVTRARARLGLVVQSNCAGLLVPFAPGYRCTHRA